MVLIGLTSVLVLTDDSVRRSLMALAVGMLIATVGVDDVYGSVRFSSAATCSATASTTSRS